MLGQRMVAFGSFDASGEEMSGPSLSRL